MDVPRRGAGVNSPLVFVRDGRTLPFIPVTVAAVGAIRQVDKRHRSYAGWTYINLLELANEGRSDRVAVTQREIVERVGAGRGTVQAALGHLQSVGVLLVEERFHGRGRQENDYVVVEPDTQQTAPPLATRATLARDTSDPCSHGEQRTQEGKEEREEEREERVRDIDAELACLGNEPVAVRLRETVEILRTSRLYIDPTLVGVANILALHQGDHKDAALRAVADAADPNYKTTNAARALDYAFQRGQPRLPLASVKPTEAAPSRYGRGRPHGGDADAA